MVWLSWISSLRDTKSSPIVDHVPTPIRLADQIYTTSFELFRNILCSDSSGNSKENRKKDTASSINAAFSRWNSCLIFQPTLQTLLRDIRSVDSESIHAQKDSLEEKMILGDLIVALPVHNELLLLLERIACSQAEFLLYTIYFLGNFASQSQVVTEQSHMESPNFYKCFLHQMEPHLNDFPYHPVLHPLFIHYTMLYHSHDIFSIKHDHHHVVVQEADRGKAMLLSYYRSHRMISPWQVTSDDQSTSNNHWILPFNPYSNHSHTPKAWLLRSYELWISLIHILISLPYMQTPEHNSTSTSSMTIDWKYLLYDCLQVPRWSNEQYHSIQALFEQLLFPTTSNTNTNTTTASSSSFTTSHTSVSIGCVWMWRMYYMIVAIHGGKESKVHQPSCSNSAYAKSQQCKCIPTKASLEEAKKIFLRGLVVCGWCKDYYLDALGLLRPVFTEKEIQSLLNVLEGIGIMLRC